MRLLISTAVFINIPSFIYCHEFKLFHFKGQKSSHLWCFAFWGTVLISGLNSKAGLTKSNTQPSKIISYVWCTHSNWPWPLHIHPSVYTYIQPFIEVSTCYIPSKPHIVKVLLKSNIFVAFHPSIYFSLLHPKTSCRRPRLLWSAAPEMSYKNVLSLFGWYHNLEVSTH